MPPVRPLSRLFPVMLALLALAALSVAGGCGGGSESRYDALPGPIRSVDLASAAALEEVPLSEDEWAGIDSMHDRYLVDFDRLRQEILAPLAREVLDAGDSVDHDAAAIARFSKRTSGALGRIQALDERIVAELAEGFPARAALAERLAERRAIDRGARVVEGASRGGDDREPTILDLERAMPLASIAPEQRAAAETAVAAYRRGLARAVRKLADEYLEFPAIFLAAREAANVTERQVLELRERAGRGEDAAEEYRRAEQALAEVRRHADAGRARALAALDDVNRRGLEAICAALPPGDADRLRAMDERLRTNQEAWLEGSRLALQVIALHPAVRDGAAPRTERAAREFREAVADVTRERIDRARAAFAARAAGEDPPAESSQDAEGSRERSERAKRTLAAMTAAIGDELGPALADTFGTLSGMTPSEAIDRLAPEIGAANAERLVRRSARTIFRSERENDDPAWSSDLSIAEQLLLAPGMDHTAFRRAARALGARDDDPLVEQIWERHRSRMDALEVQQREQLRALERTAMQDADRSREDSTSFERSLAQYLGALLSADGERREADEATFQEVAIAIDIAADDARLAVARSVSSARRASLPWRRFRQPWLLGALWESDADPLSMALEVDDEVRRTAALVAAGAHAGRLRESADAARRAGLEALRDLLLAGVRANRSGGKAGGPEELRDDPTVRSAIQRIASACAERRAAQRAAIDGVAAIDPALGARFMEDWVRSTCPEFFSDGTAWRVAESFASAGVPAGAGDGQAAVLGGTIERWKLVREDLVRRVAEWQDSSRPKPAAGSVADLVRLSATDPTLAALRTLRDESSWRLLRTAATTAGERPDARLAGDEAAGAMPRPVRWSVP